MTGIDIGARCERHVGEVFPPRCSDCSDAAAEAFERQPAVEVSGPPGGVYSSTECPTHPGYFLPCDACARAAAGA